MKWPNTVTFIRHGESGYNLLEKIKRDDASAFGAFEKRFWPEYEAAQDEEWVSDELRTLAHAARKELVDTFSKGDYMTPLTDEGVRQAQETGRRLLDATLPDVIYVSPYLRTRQTLEGLVRGCPEPGKVVVVVEERVREQEHGLATIYNDWRIYLTLNPEQALLRRRGGDYEYRFLNGENKADVRDRVRSFIATLIRENADGNALIISHNLTLLAFRANMEHWDREEFMRVEHEETPINCGVTTYEGDPGFDRGGRLVMKAYNKKLY